MAMPFALKPPLKPKSSISISQANKPSAPCLRSPASNQTAANALAARVADWRDPDDLSRPNGAERLDYASAGNGEVIGNRPFHSVDELSSVLDFPEALAPCLAPALTVFGVSGLPDRELMTRHYSGNAL